MLIPTPLSLQFVLLRGGGEGGKFLGGDRAGGEDDEEEEKRGDECDRGPSDSSDPPEARLFPDVRDGGVPGVDVECGDHGGGEGGVREEGGGDVWGRVM